MNSPKELVIKAIESILDDPQYEDLLTAFNEAYEHRSNCGPWMSEAPDQYRGGVLGSIETMIYCGWWRIQDINDKIYHEEFKLNAGFIEMVKSEVQRIDDIPIKSLEHSLRCNEQPRLEEMTTEEIIKLVSLFIKGYACNSRNGTGPDPW